MIARPRIGFIGLGRVGLALAKAWKAQGYTISAVYRRSRAPLVEIARQLAARAAVDPLEVVQGADLIFLAVPDDAILVVAEQLKAGALVDKGIVHLSGAQSSSLLGDLERVGALVGALHPAMAFAPSSDLKPVWQEVVFVLDTPSPLLSRWLGAAVAALDAQMMAIRPEDKVLYHLALVLASNYTVTLYALAQHLLGEIGIEQAVAKQALDALLASVVRNLKAMPPEQALTGPLARGDIGTVRRHLAVLADYPQLALLYRQLAEATKPLLRARGSDTRWLDALLE